MRSRSSPSRRTVVQVSQKTNPDNSNCYISPGLDIGHYAIIIVDSLFRDECLALAPRVLTDSGIMVLDNAQRLEYNTGAEELLTCGSRSLELHGPQPVSKHPGLSCDLLLRRQCPWNLTALRSYVLT
jgi:hypothetical protein